MELMAGEQTANEDLRPFDDRRRDAGRDLCGSVAEIHSHGWCPGTSGNFSILLERHPLRLLISRSGRDKRRLSDDDLVIVDADGEPVDDCAARPSAETLLHCTIAAATDAGSILHTHSVAATLLSEHYAPQGGLRITGYEMLKGLEGIRSHRAEVWVPILPNAQDMRRFSARVGDLLAEREALHGFLIAGHGLYTWGADLEQARRHVEIYEFLFECVARRTVFAPLAG